MPTNTDLKAKQEQDFQNIKEFEHASYLLYGSGCEELYNDLKELYRNYAKLLGEHDPKYGDFPVVKANKDLCTIGKILEKIEPVKDLYETYR